MGAAEAMERDGHTMTPARRELLEQWDRLVQRVEALEERHQEVCERLALLELAPVFSDVYLTSAVNEVADLARTATALLPQLEHPPGP